MKLIKPYTEILTDIKGEEFLKIIEKVTRTCKKSASILCKHLLDDHHEAMIEFADVVVKFVCDRGVSHKIVRHRLASYAQESTRYYNYTKDKFDGQITYILPIWGHDFDSNFEVNSDRELIEHVHSGSSPEYMWLHTMYRLEASYNHLIESGWKAEEARSVLPNSLKTEINVKMNLREWRHFFHMHCAKAAHPQMRELTIPLLKEFQTKIPVIFDDIMVD